MRKTYTVKTDHSGLICQSVFKKCCAGRRVSGCSQLLAESWGMVIKAGVRPVVAGICEMLVLR